LKKAMLKLERRHIGETGVPTRRRPDGKDLKKTTPKNKVNTEKYHNQIR